MCTVPAAAVSDVALNFSCPPGSACSAGAELDPDAGAPDELAAADDDDELVVAGDEVAGAGAVEEEDDEEPQAVTPSAMMTRTTMAAMRGTGRASLTWDQ
ncbi:MAG: hypothetical protein ABI355_14785 [Solirubrobacteraceae bacterium]